MTSWLSTCPPPPGVDPIIGAWEMQPLSWIVALSIPSCFILAMVMGANDVANAFGTSVGAGVITVKMACFIAAIFEFVGAVTLGAGVSETIRKGIIEIDQFEAYPELLMLGNFCSVIGASAWVGFSTVFGLPVSSTHSVVGGILGFGVVEHGTAGINVPGLTRIVVSMFISPVLAGVVSAAIYLATKYIVLNAEHEVALRRSRWYISLMIGIVVAMVVTFVLYSLTPRGTYWDWLGAVIAMATLVIVTVYLLFSPLGIDMLFRRIKLPERTELDDHMDARVNQSTEAMLEEVQRRQEAKSADGSLPTTSEVDLEQPEVEVDFASKVEGDVVIESRFASAQIVNAAYLSFNHGANDIANVAGPVASVWAIYNTATIAEEVTTQYWILCTMGVGIIVGLWVWGMPVMMTIGKKMTHISPSRGFSMELGTATSVLVASYLKIPVSTTQAAIGSVVAVGLVSGDGMKGVNWKLFSGIFVSWLVTLPFAAVVSGLSYWAFRPLVTAIYPVE